MSGFREHMFFLKRNLSYVIVAVAVVITLATFFYGLRIVNNLQNLRSSEVSLFLENRNLEQNFREFQRALGLGGFIHNVKEYLINRKFQQLNILRENIKEIEKAYVPLRIQFENIKSVHAIKTLDEFVVLLRHTYKLLSAPENRHLDAVELNNLLDLENPRFLSAIVTLESLKNSYDKESIQKIRNSVDVLVLDLIFASVLLPIILAVGGFLSWLLNRAITRKQMIEASHQKLKEAVGELRKSEEYLAKFMDSATDGFILFDSEFNYLEMNKVALEVTGLTRKEVIGQNIIDVLPSIKQTPRYDAYKKVRDTGVPCLFTDLTNYPLTGDKYIELKAFKVGEGLGIIFTDITERKRAEEENNKLEKRLNQAQKMEAIGTLAGGIAHDFNNILSAILGFTQLAKDDCKPGSAISQDLDEVLEAGNRAKGLVRQILAFSRQDDTERMNLQPASIVKETITMLRPSLPTTIEITQDIDAVTGLVFVDPTQLNQILMNLCTNAFHAMEKTGGKLDVSLKEVTLSSEDLINEPDVTDGTFIQLSIGDSGPGIARTVKDKIFDPYFTTKESGKGTGMGLSIVHGIVKSYGGFISLYSELGEGTVFHVFLPTVKQEALTENEINVQIPTGRERILFVDDEEILTKMGKTMLERLGYHVTSKNNSLEALETFQNQPDKFDIVITDQTMPGMTGSDLSRRMLQIRPDIPIILCTGYSTIISEEKAKSIGIKEFALKPLAKKDIAKLIREVLDVS
ncbi:MAG: PAS domain S-box-containing protein [Desulforhopalus sp.]|jgi:PAS domain S-box-containing protein